MTTNAKLAMLLAAGPLLCAAPALASSALTEGFVANVQPNVEFLAESSRLAATTATTPKLRAFARAEANEAVRAGDTVAVWTQANARAGRVADVAGEAVMTGRSVAIDDAAPIGATRTPAPGTLLPSGQSVLERLAKLDGRRFDALYRSAQRDVLERLAALYADYAANGDDPDLRALAARELPGVNRRLVGLRAV